MAKYEKEEWLPCVICYAASFGLLMSVYIIIKWKFEHLVKGRKMFFVYIIGFLFWVIAILYIVQITAVQFAMFGLQLGLATWGIIVWPIEVIQFTKEKNARERALEESRRRDLAAGIPRGGVQGFHEIETENEVPVVLSERPEEVVDHIELDLSDCVRTEPLEDDGEPNENGSVDEADEEAAREYMKKEKRKERAALALTIVAQVLGGVQD